MGKVSASAPGKCILFGEHAVVYGQPAVAVAVEQRISVTIETMEGDCDDWKIDGLRFEPHRHPHVEALRRRLWPKHQGAPKLNIRISGNIPRASGLGSSAALSVAASAALRTARGRWFNRQSNLELTEAWAEGYSHLFNTEMAYQFDQNDKYPSREGKLGEKVYFLSNPSVIDKDECALLGHAVEAFAQEGRASPMDASTCSHGGIVLLSDVVEPDAEYLYTRSLVMKEGKQTWNLHSIQPPAGCEEVYLVIGNTGIYAPTSEQVAKVAAALESSPERMKEIETIGLIARRGIQSLLKGDFESVGRAMTENQLMLQGLGVSCPELENLIRAAAPSSLGAKLTGAGGGGCMIALTRHPKQTSEAIELAGGRTLISTFDNKGIHIDGSEGLPLWEFEKHD